MSGVAMKIAVVVGTFPSLSETFVLSQITGMIERGHQVDIYAHHVGDHQKLHPDVKKYNLLDNVYYFPKRSENRWIRLLEALFALVRSSYDRPDYLLRVLNYKKYGTTLMALRCFYSQMPSLKQKKYDIIHCHFMFNGPAGLIIRQLSNPDAKVVTTFHGYDANCGISQRDQKKYDWLFKYCDLFTANTSFTADQAALLGCPKERIIKLPVGLNIHKYHYRETVFPDDKTIKLLTVARLVEKKGIEYSIRAVAKLVNDYPNLEYKIAGSGPLKTSLEELTASLGVDKQVHFLDWVDQNEVLKLYTNSHIFVLASVTAANGDKEGQGLVLQEAQAVGLPVISTWHNGIPDGVLDGKSGFLVAEKDVDTLADKLRYLMQNPHVWPDMSRAGRHFIEQHYDIDQLNDRLENIFGDLVKNRPVMAV
jgi:colanic acid/amylovoran biosynthesis glycosyltransferase